MKNIKITIENDELVIRIDLTKSCGESKSKKSEIIGTTSGNTKIDYKGTDINIGVNCYKKI